MSTFVSGCGNIAVNAGSPIRPRVRNVEAEIDRLNRPGSRPAPTKGHEHDPQPLQPAPSAPGQGADPQGLSCESVSGAAATMGLPGRGGADSPLLTEVCSAWLSR